MNTPFRLHARFWAVVSLLVLIPVSQAAQAPASAGPTAGQPATARLRAGAAKVDVTPPPAGNDEVRDRLYARAIYIEDGRTSAVIVTVDAGGLSTDVVNAAITELSASTGVPAANFLMSATHTHSSGAGQAARTTAAIVSAVNTAKSKLAPARVGYGTAQLDLNVNRDLYNTRLEWRQGPNPAGVSDKTLAVVGFVGDDGVPIAVYMNYGMHPINFYQSGMISADFPGEACRNVEELFDGRTVALFSQAASGDQNPRLGYSPPYSTGSVRRGGPMPVITVAPPVGGRGQAPAAAPAQAEDPLPVALPGEPAAPARGGQAGGGRGGVLTQVQGGSGTNPTARGTNPTAAAAAPAIPHESAAYKKVIARVGEYVTMLGQMVGTTAVRVMREDIQYTDNAAIWGGFERFTVPGRTRNDAADPARENVFPGYSEGAEVTLRVGVLRIGDINFVGVNGEIYTNIALGVKKGSPASKTLVVTLANGSAGSGYIYSDDAYTHLTFQVIGSRLQPGFAEKGIISHAVELLKRPTQP